MAQKYEDSKDSMSQLIHFKASLNLFLGLMKYWYTWAPVMQTNKANKRKFGKIIIIIIIIIYNYILL